jgi:anionic cell wall polymer biosynthesis LytR-Cps2A-Psr (LCP) family protein
MREKKDTKRGLAVRIGLITLAVLAVAFSASALFMYYQLDKVRINRISKSDEDLGITEYEAEPEAEMSPAEVKRVGENNNVEAKPITREKSKEDNTIVNIALFGIDTGRQRFEAAHSDAIMILSIDNIHKKIKLSSFIRDTYVSVDGHGKKRINTAYMFGGPQLAIKTLNKNFRMNIRDYYTVNFSGLTDIIDSVGGVELDVGKDGISEINKYMSEIARIKR